MIASFLRIKNQDTTSSNFYGISLPTSLM